LLFLLLLGGLALYLWTHRHAPEPQQVAKGEGQPPSPAPDPRDLSNEPSAPPNKARDPGAETKVPPTKPKADTPRPVAPLLSTLPLPGEESIHCLAFSRDGKALAAGGSKGIYVFDVASGQCKTTLKGPADEPLMVYSVAFSPTDNNLLASECASNTEYCVMLWDVAGSKNTANFDAGPPFGGYLPVAFSPDGKTLASGAMLVKLWDVATGKNTATLSEPKPFTTGLAFSPDGKTVAVTSDGKKVLFWDVATRRSTTALEPEIGYFWGLAFNKDGKTLALEGETVQLWRMGNGKETRPVTQIRASGGVFYPVFSPDGKLLAHYGSGSTVCLWDVAGGKDLATVSKFTGSGLSGVAFSPDGKILAWGGTEKAIKLWRIDSDALPDAHLEQNEAIPKGPAAK